VTYDDWGAPEMKAILKLGVRELDLVTEYTGHPWDPVLGAYYARARMYDAADRRFMAMDPVKACIMNPQSLALYTYVLDNPTKYIDPWGLFVRILDDRTKKAVIDKWGRYITETGKSLLAREGVLHFDESKADGNLTRLRIYQDSISETANYIYQVSWDARVYAQIVGTYPPKGFEYPFFVTKKMDGMAYFHDRESRLYFLKHYARVQALKHIEHNPSYFPRHSNCGKCTPITDAEAFRNIVQYAIDLNSYLIDDPKNNHQVLDDLMHTIGPSKYVEHKIKSEFYTYDPEGPLTKGDSIYQLGLRTFGQTGFSKDLQEDFGEKDPNPNNVQHHLLAIYLGYYKGDWAFIPAWYHEYLEVGGTERDWESSVRGISLGVMLKKGEADMKDLANSIYLNITYEK